MVVVVMILTILAVLLLLFLYVQTQPYLAYAILFHTNDNRGYTYLHVPKEHLLGLGELANATNNLITRCRRMLSPSKRSFKGGGLFNLEDIGGGTIEGMIRKSYGFGEGDEKAAFTGKILEDYEQVPTGKYNVYVIFNADDEKEQYGPFQIEWVITGERDDGVQLGTLTAPKLQMTRVAFVNTGEKFSADNIGVVVREDLSKRYMIIYRATDPWDSRDVSHQAVTVKRNSDVAARQIVSELIPPDAKQSLPDKTYYINLLYNEYKLWLGAVTLQGIEQLHGPIPGQYDGVLERLRECYSSSSVTINSLDFHSCMEKVDTFALGTIYLILKVSRLFPNAVTDDSVVVNAIAKLLKCFDPELTQFLKAYNKSRKYWSKLEDAEKDKVMYEVLFAGGGGDKTLDCLDSAFQSSPILETIIEFLILTAVGALSDDPTFM